ncbi:MAG TPA: phosphatase PAP2 family protein [Solirubrobacterales bacterium]|nr:phosphatase PAP2 family protein [Solirubrobacterales bacterium]
MAGRRREAFAAVAVVAAANLTGLLLKVVLAHPRFYPVLGTDQVGIDAFPSGHATGAMSIALAATLVAPARIRPAVALGAAAYVFAVSILLLVLSWHLPSDVPGGLLVASSFFCAVAALRGSASPADKLRERGEIVGAFATSG